MKFFVLLVCFNCVFAQGNNFCKEPNGVYEDPEQCDKYYECYDGEAIERLCPDGLVFDFSLRKKEPCDHYFNVPCGNRLKLQTPRGTTEFCPRLNGFYAHPDETECRIFYSCIDGVAEKVECPVGLYFDEFSGTCNWPEGTDRLNCKNEKVDDDVGFRCPDLDIEGKGSFGVVDPHPKYADPTDCAKFYICLNGVSPRIQGCEKGLVFNTETNECDSAENVPECKDYYKFLDEDNIPSNE